ncbi:hypothetical protein Bbelb_280850 [Branchiostoma belcheri]|nr:hypothetical protein Bbelb_280850 [Branchiostoma belcheri]
MLHDVWSKDQKNLLQLLEEEKCDLTWRSTIYNLPKGILSFAVHTSIHTLPTFCNLATWGKRSSDRCKLCGNRETLHHVLNHYSVSLQQGRYTFPHNRILKHIMDSIQEAIDPSQINA